MEAVWCDDASDSRLLVISTDRFLPVMYLIEFEIRN